MNRRLSGYLHAEFFEQFPRKRFKLGLSSLDVAARQVPLAWVGITVRAAKNEQDSGFTDQCPDDDLIHDED